MRGARSDADVGGSECPDAGIGQDGAAYGAMEDGRSGALLLGTAHR